MNIRKKLQASEELVAVHSLSKPELLDIERVKLTKKISSKKKALQAISELLASAQPNLTVDEVFSSLVQRERLGCTALKTGVALPHGRLKGLNNAVGAFIKTDTAVNFESDNDTAVDLLFAILVPEEIDQRDIDTLTGLTQLFNEDEFISKLREAESADATHALLTANISFE